MKAKLRIVSIIIVVACAVWACSPPAEATLITIGIEAEVDLVGDEHDYYLQGKIKPGDTVTGTYTYDSDTPDQDWLWGSESDVVGRYHHFTPPYGVMLSVGDFVFRTDPDSVNFVISIVNDNTSGEDIYGLRSDNNLPLLDGTYVGGISWELRDNTGTAFSSDALPGTAPVLDDWEFNELWFGGGIRGAAFGVISHVTSATVIPEPGTLILLSMGALIVRKRK